MILYIYNYFIENISLFLNVHYWNKICDWNGINFRTFTII